MYKMWGVSEVWRFIQTFKTLCSRSCEGRMQAASPKKAMRTWRTSVHSPTVSMRTSKPPSLNVTQCKMASIPVCWFCSSVNQNTQTQMDISPLQIYLFLNVLRLNFYPSLHYCIPVKIKLKKSINHDTHLECRTAAQCSRVSAESKTSRRLCGTRSGQKLLWWKPQFPEQWPK